MMRKKAMSKGSKWCAAEARATTMKDDQISTVTTAAVSPSAWGENFIRRMIICVTLTILSLDWGVSSVG